MAAAVLIHAALGTSWEDGGASMQWYFSQDFAGETCSAVCNSFGGLDCNPGVLDSSIPKYVGYWPTTRSQMAVPLSDSYQEYGVVTAINAANDSGFTNENLQQYLDAAKVITARLAELAGGLARA